MDTPNKTCTKCGKALPATPDYFYRQRAGKYGLTAHCKTCDRQYIQCHKEERRAYLATYRSQHREAENAKVKRYRDRNRDIIRLRDREKYWRNPERERQRVKNYRQRNKEKVREYHRRYQQSANGALRCRVGARNRRARKSMANGVFTATDFERQLKAQHNLCYYCGSSIKKHCNIEHVVPLIRGGSNAPENIVLACPACNHKKHDKLPHEWPEGGRLL